MDRIAIIGSPGAGKSTLARRLGRKLKIQVVHLDRNFWLSGWKQKPLAVRIGFLQDCVRKRQWIIEGTYLDSSEPRLDAADTIIFLDIPFFICLYRIIKRHFKCQGQHRHDLKVGCPDKLTLIRILKVLVFPIRGRLMLKHKLRIYRSKYIIKLSSTEEVEAFLAQLEARTNEKNTTIGIPSIPRNRQLTSARR
jgi:adenylate kinase family enzyme